MKRIVMQFNSTRLATVFAGLMLLGGPATARTPAPVPAPARADKSFALPRQTPQPADNVTTTERVRLGKALFFDPRLSGNGSVSCASCHNPSLGWSDGLATGIGINGQRLPRNSPTVVNVGLNTQFMWDGRFASLEKQALGPLEAEQEMSADFKHMKFMLDSLQGYRALFDKAYPGEPLSEQTVAKALAAFERTVVSGGSRFDKWLAGDRRAITMQEWRGFQLFKASDKGNCMACHSGPNFTDNGFHNIGVAQETPDTGRFKVRALASMKSAFKTPTLRDIELTAPYFHDGSAATLRQVVEHYNRGGDPRAAGTIAPEVKPLNLTEAEMNDLVAFMKTLTGKRSPVELPALPR
ncbi:MAG: cytochrome-c peroxidase [Telluria sp.]